jgi:hypothetical protein
MTIKQTKLLIYKPLLAIHRDWSILTTKKHHWYEKLFFGLQLREKGCWRLVIGLLMLMIIIQVLLMDARIRSKIVLMERLEGEPVKFYKSLNHK